jgi:hypothetical protein
MVEPKDKVLIENLSRAAQALGVEWISPFTLGNAGVQKTFLAWVPDFGGAKGMLLLAAVLPDMRADGEAIEMAEKMGFGISVLNADVYAAYDENRFMNMLRDWQFVGAETKRPRWL